MCGVAIIIVMGRRITMNEINLSAPVRALGHLSFQGRLHLPNGALASGMGTRRAAVERSFRDSDG